MTNQVRVFFSSTFLDFNRERELIHTQVLPTLDDMCRHFGLSIELSDLRWGVTAKDVDQNRTASICLEEVDLCRQVSPELNFLLLLGDRVGSRFIPDQVSVKSFEALLAELMRVDQQKNQASTLAKRLRTLFPASRLTRAGFLLRDDSPSAQALAETILGDLSTAKLLTSFSCANPSEEELRRSLAFSLTHQEVLRSRAIAPRDRNEGAIAIIRTLDQPEELQHQMRRAVSQAFGERAEELTAVVDEWERSNSSYETDFVRRCTALLGARVNAARARGSKSHHFSQLPRRHPGIPIDPKSSNLGALRDIESWIYSASGSRVVAINGGKGAGRTTVLRRAKSMIQSLETSSHILHLEVQASPELQALRNLAITLIVWASSTPLSEAEIKQLSSDLVPDLIARATRELGRIESSDRLFVLIDDLDLVIDGDDRAALSWLWSGASSRKVLFTCGASLTQKLRENADVEIIQLDNLSDIERLTVVEEACKERGAGWLDARSLADAARAHSTPGYIHSLIDAALCMDLGMGERLASSGPVTFFSHFLEHLQDSAPFSRSICNLFLGLSACSEYGVTEREFLSICYDSNEIRQELLKHFPVRPFAERVPPLVWHRLTRHFTPTIELLGYFGAIAGRLRAQFTDTVRKSVGSVFLRNCKERLAEHLLADLSRPTERAALLLPGLLTSIERDEVLAKLVLAQPFMKVSVLHDQAEALVRTIGSSPAHNQIVEEIVRGALEPNELGADQQSHWLLDLSVLTRQLGHYHEAGDLATRASEIRRSHLGSAHSLTIVAVLEATDCDLEAGEYVRAERLCKETLQAANQDYHHIPALLRVMSNLASALTYQKLYDEAESLLLELLAVYENNGGEDRELFGVYNGLGVCSGKRGALDEARRYATKSVAFASKFYGHRSLNAAIAQVNLGVVLLEAGLPGEAVSVFELTLRIYSEVRDGNHPWAMNAAVGYFSALSESAKVPEAIDFLCDWFARITHFDDCAVWIQHTIREILQIVDANDAVRIRLLLSPMHMLAESSPGEAWTGSLAARAAQKSAGALGLEDEIAAKGFLVSGIYLWILAVLAATLRDLITRDEAEGHLRVLEDRLAAIFGVPMQFLSLEEKMKLAWQAFAGEYAARGDCEVLLCKLRPPSPSISLLAAFEAEESRAVSIEEMKRRVDVLGKSSGEISDERGQELIKLAARSASEGWYEEAIAAQTEAVAIACNLYGTDSIQHAIAIINLGGLFFRASRFADAFKNYSEGIMRALHDGVPFEDLGGSVNNLATAGFKAGKFSETGHTFSVFAELVSPSPAAINFLFLSVSALAKAGALAAALDGLERAMGIHAQMSFRDGEAWLEPILTVAGGLNQQLGDSEKVHLCSILRGFSETAEANGWTGSLLKMQEWVALQAGLNL